MTAVQPSPAAPAASGPRQDPAREIAERVELLLAQMRLEEKVAQLGSRWVGNVLPHGETDQRPDGDRDAVVSGRPYLPLPSGA